MSSYSYVIWFLALIIGVAVGAMRQSADAPTASLEASLGPEVHIQRIAH